MMARRRVHFPLLCFIFLFCFLLQGSTIIRAYSQTYDEAVHIVAGYTYWKTGDFRINHEHPPLTKLISALPVYLFFSPNITSRELTDPKASQWELGKRFLYRSGEDADAMLNAARVPNLLLGASLLALVGRWAYRLWGRRAAVFAMAIGAFEPTLLAHSSLATTEIGVAFFFFAMFYCAWEYLQQNRRLWLVLTGACFGLAVASKFSALIGLPIFFFAVATRTKLLRAIRDSLSVLVVGGVVVCMTYGFTSSVQFIDGFHFQLQHQESGHLAYLLGETSTHGWPHYFLVAMLVKLPLGLLVLIGIAIFSRGEKSLLLLAPPLLLLSLSTMATVNIGIRYLLPAFPFLMVLIGKCTLQKRLRPWVPIAAICSITSAIWCSPHSLSYFNESIGGPRHGSHVLADSNVDWGQGLRLLRGHLQRTGETANVEYFGTADLDYYLGDLIADDDQTCLTATSAHRSAMDSQAARNRAERLVGYSLSIAPADSAVSVVKR